MLQHLPWHRRLSHLRLLAKLQPVLGPRLGSGPAFGDHQGYTVYLQGLDAEGC